MSGALALTVATPLRIALQAEGLASVRGEDATGGFGILPGHSDFLTVIDAGVLRWRAPRGPWRFAALRGAVLTVAQGARIDVACREAILGDDLPSLEAQVAQARAAGEDADKRARAHATQLHARAIRRLMIEMSLAGDGAIPEGLE